MVPLEMGGTLTRVGAHKRKIVVITTFLVALVGVSGLEQLSTSTSGMSATAQAGTALSKSVVARNAQIKAASAAKTKAAAAGPKATTSRLTLKVDSARTSTLTGGPKQGDAINQYHWLINLDNSGDSTQPSSQAIPYNQPGGDICHPKTPTSPNGDPFFHDPAKQFASGCQWPSLHRADSPPVVSEGTEADWNTSLAIPAATSPAGRGLQPGKYLVSVTSNGYQLGGAHFSMPNTSGVIDVALNPYPIPLGNMVLKSFLDMSPTDSFWDVTKPGLAGFRPKLSDYDGLVTVDYFGNPLCTTYKMNGAGKIILAADGAPEIDTPGSCRTDVNGDITIPNLAPNRYSVQLAPPNATDYVQTTTLEGNHDFDVWIMPNDTGLDTEMVVGGEPVPFVNLGFVKPTPMPAMTNADGSAATGEVKGRIMGTNVYQPGKGGVPGDAGMAGSSGTKRDVPVPHAWLALADMSNNDQTFFAAETAADGSFDVKGLPPGDYFYTAWDQPQDYFIDNFQFSVTNPGQVIDLGVVPLLGWWSHISGHVFLDLNGNGRQDPGEHGIPGLPVQNLGRNNNGYNGGQNVSKTDLNGFYDLKEAYPVGQFTVNQAFFTRYKTTGVTWQACNDPQEHSMVTALVDVSFLPIISQCGRLDWGVKPYDAASGENGGIVATAQYDDIRLKYNARQAQSLQHQPGIPDVKFELLAPVKDANGTYAKNADGSFQGTQPWGQPTPTVPGVGVTNYVSENWGRPQNCVPLDVNGNLLTDQDSVPIPDPAHGYNPECVESAITGTAFGVGIDNANGHGPQTVDGNYTLLSAPPPGYTTTTGDWLVQTTSPGDKVLPPLANGLDRPLYTVTTENDVNNTSASHFVPQGADTSALTWPMKPGKPFQTPVGVYPENPGTTSPNPDPICAGPTHTVTVTNPGFQSNGGSPFEGQVRNTCGTKLLHVAAGQSIAPNFHFHTVVDVPIPTKYSGYIVDDVSVSTDRRSTAFGEVAGIANAPIGIYDWSGRLLQTATSDPNGQFEVIMPSSDHQMCPVPAGTCPNVYRFVGNDPGQPGAPNVNWNPAYRTIAANFEAWPGLIVPADTAPTKAAMSLEGPGAQFTVPSVCAPKITTPEVFAVNKPYIKTSQGNTMTLTIDGQGFGAAKGSGAVRLNGVNNALPTTSWSDRHIDVTINGNNLPAGPHGLTVTNATGQTGTNGVTFHVVKGNYNPTIFEVGPGKTYQVIQDALEAAAKLPANNQNALVVVYPTTPSAFTPLGAYYENIVIHSPVKVQGVGPGGIRPDGTFELGTTIDGRFFWQSVGVETLANSSAGFTEPYMLAWQNLVASLTFQGDPLVPDGQTVTVLAPKTTTYTASYKAAVDGFKISGGDQRDFPGNISSVGGNPFREGGSATGETKGVVLTQGGAILLHAQINNFQITNNLVQGNNGAYGVIRVGMPYPGMSPELLPELIEGGTPNFGPNHNHNVEISHNRIVANGGTNLGGAIALFDDSNNYRVSQNEICGNHSTEYGGGVSHFGYSPGGRIDHNQIMLNEAVDEGGGIMVAGELPQIGHLSKGSGPVSIDHNYIGDNLAADDGGGVRFLMAGNYPIDVTDNMITNNISAHEGGGIAIDDAPNVRIVNNTIAKNITTATGRTSDGLPAPAGISTTRNSRLLQASLPAGSDVFSNPLVLNNILYDNRAGSWTPNGVAGIGVFGDLTPINFWDLGTADNAGKLQPHYSVLGSPANPTNALQGYTDTPADHNIVVAPSDATTDQIFGAGAVLQKRVYDTHLTVNQWRTYARFRPSAIVAIDLPENVLGDYHVQTGSPADNTGASGPVTYRGASIAVPTTDIDDLPRPSGRGDLVEIGANEIVAGGGAPDAAAPAGGGAPNAAAPYAAGGSRARAPQGSWTTDRSATSGSWTTTTGTPGGHGLPGLLTHPATPSHGNQAGTGFISAVGNELARFSHNPATLPVALFLVVLALPVGIIIYRRRRKGTAR
jgi:hypothetical protein